MIKGTIKDYTITTLEELIERKVTRDHKEHKVCIHTYLDLQIIGFKWETKQRNKYPYYQGYTSDISIHSVKRSTNQFRSQFTKQTLWEIVKYLYS